MTPPSAPMPVSVTLRPRVLLVDDEQRVLDALSRTLRRCYDTVTATSGAAGLIAIQSQGPFAVIVSDMRMQGMDGAGFLARARGLRPESVRVLLTGQADIDSAMNAVNDGQIFRFLRKPCPPELLEATLAQATEHHQLITAERELLEQTLRGSVEVLTDVLALVSPVAFARSLRLKRLVIEMAEALDVSDRWAVELAAMLCELGAITIPPDVLQRHYRGEALTAGESEMIAGAPDVANQLIAHVPRLEPVREILRAQRGPQIGEAGSFGARLLRLATDFDVLESRGESAASSIAAIESRADTYDPRAVRALRTIKCGAHGAGEIREIALRDVRAGMVFVRDVVATNGLVLIGRGQEATPSLVRRIQNFWCDMAVTELPLVSIPVAP